MIKHGDDRRTEIVRGSDFDIEDEDLIPEEQVIITLTNNGYIKRCLLYTSIQKNIYHLRIKCHVI